MALTVNIDTTKITIVKAPGARMTCRQIQTLISSIAGLVSFQPNYQSQASGNGAIKLFDKAGTKMGEIHTPGANLDITPAASFADNSTVNNLIFDLDATNYGPGGATRAELTFNGTSGADDAIIGMAVAIDGVFYKEILGNGSITLAVPFDITA